MSEQKSEFRVWLDTAWNEWIRPMGAIIIAVAVSVPEVRRLLRVRRRTG